jgi:hypothetical protein
MGDPKDQNSAHDDRPQALLHCQPALHIEKSTVVGQQQGAARPRQDHVYVRKSCEAERQRA